MSPEAIGALGAGMAEGPLDLSVAGRAMSVGPAADGFSGMVAQGLEQVNRQLKLSETGVQQLALGDSSNLHHLMIQLEESRTSFQLMMQARNRLLEAYQEVMRMQI